MSEPLAIPISELIEYVRFLHRFQAVKRDVDVEGKADYFSSKD